MCLLVGALLSAVGVARAPDTELSSLGREKACQGFPCMRAILDQRAGEKSGHRPSRSERAASNPGCL